MHGAPAQASPFQSQLDAAGLKLVLISNGTPQAAQKFVTSMPYYGELYLDEGSTTYRAIGLKRLGLGGALSRYALQCRISAFASVRARACVSPTATRCPQATASPFPINDVHGTSMDDRGHSEHLPTVSFIQMDVHCASSGL